MKDSFFVLTFFIRRPKARGDGEYPIYARITTNGQSIEFTIYCKVNPEDCVHYMVFNFAVEHLHLNKFILLQILFEVASLL